MPPKHLTVPATADGVLVERFADYQRVRGFSPRSVDRRTWTLCRWLAHLDGRRLGDAGALDVVDWLAAIPSAQSRYSLRSDLRQFYRWATRLGLLEVDPTDGTDPPRLPRRLPTPVTALDVARLLEVCTGVDRLLVMLGALAGLRVSEIANLHGEDIDLDARRLVVRSGKGGADGVVPVAAPLAAELARWPRHGRIVDLPDGQAVALRIRRAFRRHGVTGRPHDLRAAFATAAADATNGNVTLVQQLMRHTSVTSTMRYIALRPAGTDVVDRLFT
jgi:integrase